MNKNSKIALVLLEKLGTEIDKEKAVEWYKIASERGNKDA